MLDIQLARELTSRLKAGAEIVAEEARRRIVVRTGRARSTIRAGATIRQAMVRGGGQSAPYFGWLDFGGRIRRHGGGSITRPYEPRGRYLYPSAEDKQHEVAHEISEGIDDLLRRAGFH